MRPLRAIALTLAIFSTPLFAQTLVAPGAKPSESPTANASAGTATVYFYRIREGYGSLLKPSVFSDGAQLGRMRNGRFFTVQIPVGTHNITSVMPGNGARIEMKAGETYYFKVDISRPGLVHGGRGEVTAVTPEQGGFEVTQLKPADPQDIKPDGGAQQ